jgi:hypothetical protein
LIRLEFLHSLVCALATIQDFRIANGLPTKNLAVLLASLLGQQGEAQGWVYRVLLSVRLSSCPAR